jgi:peroxiredoxin/outer membrane lipoprotein-sorting protein
MLSVNFVTWLSGGEIAMQTSLRNRLKRVYRNLQSYQDCTYITFRLPEQNCDEMRKGGLEYQILFQPPNLCKIIIGEGKGVGARSEPMHLISDGSRFVDYRPERLEYTEQKAPENTKELFELIAGLLPKHSGRHWLGLLFLFVYDDVIDALLPPEIHVDHKGIEVIRGRNFEKIVSLQRFEDAHCDGTSCPTENRDEYECTFWFDVENGMLCRLNTEISEIEGAHRQIVAAYCEDHSEIQVNTKINPECFVFHPPPGAKRVEYLSNPLMTSLRGKPAPEFSLPVYGGGKVRLSNLKEQIVVIVCWSLGCPSCPPALDLAQKLHEEFAGDKLRVLGVTADDPEDIAQILNEKGIEFETLLDQSNEFSTAYMGQIIPRFYVINKGIVQDEIFGCPNPKYIRSELRKALSEKP